MNCEICDTTFSFSWTDTHGVGQCLMCGTPYRIYHYDENNKRIEKPPTVLILPEYIEKIKDYWNQTHRRMPSGCSVPGGYEIATPEEQKQFYEWMDKEGDNG